MHHQVIARLCTEHQTDYTTSLMLVCDRRKVVHVLSFGVIDSVDCFRDEDPTASFSRAAMVESATSPRCKVHKCIVPNGWKVLVTVGKKNWFAEVTYVLNKPMYRMTLLDDEGNAVQTSVLSDAPLGAYRQFFNADQQHLLLKGVNAKLFFGCQYESPQHKIMQFFDARLSRSAFVSQAEAVQREFVFMRAMYEMAYPRPSTQSPAVMQQSEEFESVIMTDAAFAFGMGQSPKKKMKVEDEEAELSALLTANMSSWVGW